MTVINSRKRNVVDLVNNSLAEEDITPWEGTLEEYLPKVIENPKLNDLAHARIWRMIEAAGVEFDEDDEKKKNPKYNFFKDDLFGVDKVLAQIVEYFKAAAAGSEVSKRILLLWGPTSSGKSELATMIKRGLELFSRTKEGEVYALSESPMYENPLLAIPHHARDSIRKEYGIRIEGDLSPKMSYILEQNYNGDFWKLPVKRIFLSEQKRIGIGTFHPADPKCCTLDTLVLTSNGLEEIGALGQHHEQNIKNNMLMPDGSFQKTSKFFLYKKQPVLKIKTQYGYEIDVTKNHPLLSIDSGGNYNWIKAGKLKIGDSLVLAKNQGFEHVKFEELPKNELNLKWSSDLAFLFGVYVAEGNFACHNTAIELSAKKSEMRKMIYDAACSVGLGNNTHDYHTKITISKKAFATFMTTLGFTKGAHNKEIPTCVFSSGYLKYFLKGMWLGDGNAGKHKIRNTNEMTYGTVSKKLSMQVQQILTAYGIPCNRQYEPDVGTSGFYKIVVSSERVYDLWRLLNVPDWKLVRPFENIAPKDNVLLMPPVGNLVGDICNSTKGLSGWYRYSVPNLAYGRRFSSRSIQKFCLQAEEKGGDSALISKLKNIKNEKLFYLNITYIKKYKADVCDVEVPKTHMFIANSFVSHNSQNQSELTGSVNFAKLEEHGVESHPMAFNFDGELNVSNRGAMEFIELLKVDPKFRHILLTLAQEKRIKVERFPLIYADLVPIAHTNESEYNKFLADKTEEALHDRLWVVKFPYNLSLDSEIKIYEKLICGTATFQDVHIAPHTLKIAAMLAVLSRLEEPKNKSITLLQKLHLYNGKKVDKISPEEEKEMKLEAEREGLDGISPRYVVNRLAACFARHGVKTITPIDAIRSLSEGFDSNAKLDKQEIERLRNLISLCVEEYNKIAMNEVQKAFFLNFEHEIKNLLENYIDNVGASLDKSKIENEWGEHEEPNERLMRSIEEKIDISGQGAQSFREEVYRKMLKSKGELGHYDYQSHPKLKEALQRQLFSERADVIRLTVSSRNPDEEGLKRINQVVKTLVDEYGYNADSANELLRYVNNIMAKSG